MSALSQSSDGTDDLVEMQWGVKIPLRDGIRLNATLYRPSLHTKASPALFTLTPYVAQTYHDIGMHFAAHGYPFLTVDVRGRGNSEGEFRPCIQEARDGHDVVEWLATQPYCDGQVAMWGGSYAGYNQWATAKEFPLHLATIVPVASVYPGVDFPMRNNITSPYIMQWLTFVSGRTSQERIFWEQSFWRKKFWHWFKSGRPHRELDQFLGNPSTIFQEWLAHPQRSAYWDGHNPTAEERAKLTIPILTITGIYDTDQPGALAHYREHLESSSATARARHYLVIGPWHHAGTRTPTAEFAGFKFGSASLVDLLQLHRQWYAWTMQGGPKPDFLKKNVAYYVTGAEKWRYADTLEAVTASTKVLYLNSAGSSGGVFTSAILAEEIAPGPDDVYIYDPADSTTADLELESTDPLCLRPTFPNDSLTDQRAIFGNEGKQFVYHSAPFEAATEISGFFKLSMWISIDQPDTDFGAAIYEINLDGHSVLLTSDVLRARYRESLREEKLIQTLQPLRYDFGGFTFVSRLIRKGSRLRLVIGPINSIYSQKNYNSGGAVAEESAKNARPVTVRLIHDYLRPSSLCIPLGQTDYQHGRE
jgi:putative CocE/NonD family hydrolase